MTYFSERHTNKNKIKDEQDLSNYATKSDLKNPTSADTLKFVKKDNLVNSKSVNGNRY